MTDPRYNALLIVLDRSGSMGFIRQPMIDAVTQIVREHGKQPGLATVDLWLFDEVVEHAIHLGDPHEIDIRLEPRGSTALLDAVGLAVTHFKRSICSWPEHSRPSGVEVLVISDGFDNASEQFTSDQVRALIESRRDDDFWEFTFIGSEERAIFEAARMGFEAGRSLRFDASEQGTRAMGDAISKRLRHGNDDQSAFAEGQSRTTRSTRP